MSLCFFSLIRLRDELPILLLTIVRTRQERISQLNKNERRKGEMKKKYLLIGDGSLLYIYQLNFYFFLKDKKN
jgi:hypothetical protein